MEPITELLLNLALSIFIVILAIDIFPEMIKGIKNLIFEKKEKRKLKREKRAYGRFTFDKDGNVKHFEKIKNTGNKIFKN